MSSNVEYQANMVIKENVEPRLISSVSRTGRVIYQDDFETYTSVLTEKWLQSQGTTTLDTGSPFRGKVAAKLVTAASIGAQGQITKTFQAAQNNRIGVEFWWDPIGALADIDNMTIQCSFYDGTNSTTSKLIYFFTNASGTQKWQYLDNTNSWVDVPTGAQTIYYDGSYPCYHHFKAVLDFNNAKYVSFVSDNKIFTPATLGMYVVGDATYPRIVIRLGITAKTATAITMYVDDFILTDQEP